MQRVVQAPAQPASPTKIDQKLFDPVQMFLPGGTGRRQLEKKILIAQIEGPIGKELGIEQKKSIKQVNEGTGFAGVEIGPYLKKAMAQLDNDWAAMKFDEKIAIAKTLLQVPSVSDIANEKWKTGGGSGGLTGWDIRELSFTEAPGKATFTSGKYGNGIFQQFVTVNGDVYYAGGVNYILWGKLNRLIWNDLTALERKGDISQKNGKWVASINGEDFEAVNPNSYSMLSAQKTVALYRNLLKDGVGLDERIAWTKVGYTGEYWQAIPLNYNDFINPAPKTLILTTGLTFRFGLNPDRTFIYKKEIAP